MCYHIRKLARSFSLTFFYQHTDQHSHSRISLTGTELEYSEHISEKCYHISLYITHNRPVQRKDFEEESFHLASAPEDAENFLIRRGLKVK